MHNWTDLVLWLCKGWGCCYTSVVIMGSLSSLMFQIWHKAAPTTHSKTRRRRAKWPRFLRPRPPQPRRESPRVRVVKMHLVGVTCVYTETLYNEIHTETLSMHFSITTRKNVFYIHVLAMVTHSCLQICDHKFWHKRLVKWNILWNPFNLVEKLYHIFKLTSYYEIYLNTKCFTNAHKLVVFIIII